MPHRLALAVALRGVGFLARSLACTGFYFAALAIAPWRPAVEHSGVAIRLTIGGRAVVIRGVSARFRQTGTPEVVAQREPMSTTLLGVELRRTRSTSRAIPTTSATGRAPASYSSRGRAVPGTRKR